MLEIADVQGEHVAVRQIAAQVLDVARCGGVAEQRDVLDDVDGCRRRVSARARREVLADGHHEVGARDREPLDAPQQPVEGLQSAILAEQLLG